MALPDTLIEAGVVIGLGATVSLSGVSCGRVRQEGRMEEGHYEKGRKTGRWDEQGAGRRRSREGKKKEQQEQGE